VFSLANGHLKHLGEVMAIENGTGMVHYRYKYRNRFVKVLFLFLAVP